MEKQPLNRIKVMLAERMLTNKQLAEMLGKDPATISKWVTNTSQPTLENLIEIARCLKCDMNDLVRLDDIAPIKKITSDPKSITLCQQTRMLQSVLQRSGMGGYLMSKTPWLILNRHS